MQRRIGLFGGSFNPVHFGHISLTQDIKEEKQLSEIWVFPANVSPLREEPSLAAKGHRLKMAEIAFSEIPGYKVFDWELKRPPPSYTIETVKQVLENYPKDDFFLLLGSDVLRDFVKWHRVNELMDLVPILVGARPGSAAYVATLPTKVKKKFEEGFVQTHQMEISGTEIRERLKKKLYCGHLVPVKVLDYICENQLYFNA